MNETRQQDGFAALFEKSSRLHFPGNTRCSDDGAVRRFCHSEKSRKSDHSFVSDKSDFGFVYRKNDFKAAIAGYGEGLVDPGNSGNSFRRARQSLAMEFPRFTKKYRAAFVYEVDFTDSNFFRNDPRFKIFENLFVAVQDAKDAGKFRALIGENTHILSREDNLSLGNLPRINRSLILEEHGSTGSFGTQFGIQV